MKYYKNLTNGGVVKTEKAPAGDWWQEVTERDYIEYRARIARLMGNLERAVAHKRARLGV